MPANFNVAGRPRGVWASFSQAIEGVGSFHALSEYEMLATMLAEGLNATLV
jgi:hypothetical protein